MAGTIPNYGAIYGAARQKDNLTPFAMPKTPTGGWLTSAKPQDKPIPAAAYAGVVGAAQSIAAPVNGVTPTMSQMKARTHIVGSGNYGTLGDYATNNINRYGNQGISYDALQKDSARVGYAIPGMQISDVTATDIPAAAPSTPAPVAATPPVYTPPVNLYPQLTPEQIAEEQRAKAAALIQQRTTAANQAKQGINTSYERLKTNIGQDRALQDNYNGRQLSPFSGRSDFTLGIQAMERGRSDREAQQDLQTRLANIDVSLQDFENATEDQRQAMINESIRQERDYGLNVDNQKYGQWSDQRNFGYQAGQDQIRNDAQYGGTYGGKQTVDQQQRDWENRFNYGVSTGQFANGQKTLQGQEFAYQQARDKIADTQYKAKFDEDVRQFGMNYAADQAVKNRQMSQDDARIAIQRSQESRLSSGDGGSGNPKPAKYSYKSDPEFSKEIGYINGNPAGALAEIQNNAQALIQAYGYDGYQELLKQATPKKK